VAPPSDKFNNFVFYWQNQARPLYLTACFFEIPAPNLHNFGTIPQRDILNMSITFMLINCLIWSGAIWWNTKTCY